MSAPREYEPGNYVYAFQYRLPPNLPGVVDVKSSRPTAQTRGFKARIEYALSVRLDVKGFFVANLGTKQELRIHALESPTRPIRAIEASSSKSVNFLALFNKGDCDVHAVLNNHIQVAGDELFVDVRIHNGSTKNMRRISLELIQEVVPHGKAREGDEFSNAICKRSFPGVDAETSVQTTLSLKLIDLENNRAPIPKSTHGELFVVRYLLQMRCIMDWCPNVNLAFPLTIIDRGSVPLDINMEDTGIDQQSFELLDSLDE